MQKCLIIQVFGRVQGVGYRYFTRNAAGIAGINGYVRNMADGSVYIEAEGDSAQLEAFTSLCRQGPPRSVVEKITISECPLMNYNVFAIK